MRVNPEYCSGFRARKRAADRRKGGHNKLDYKHLPLDLHYMPHHMATLSCHRHVNKLATEPLLLLHCEHGTIRQQS